MSSNELPPFDLNKEFKITGSPNPGWSFTQPIDSLPGDPGQAWVEGDEKGWTVVDTSKTEPRKIYQITTSGIVPRPIAFISSISGDGVGNLGPFSWFNQVSHNPPVLSVSILHRADREKDTLRNIKETKGFTVNIISEAWAEQANAASVDAPIGFSEWEISGLTKAASIHVKAPRVKESAFSMECELLHTVELSEPLENKVTTTLVLATIKCIHMRNDILGDRGLPDIGKLKPVSRIGAPFFARVSEGFSLVSVMESWKELESEINEAMDTRSL